MMTEILSPDSQRRPKLVFFRSVRQNLPLYIQLHLHQHVDCLRHFFDVVVLDSDCDFQEVCDTHEPDLALFETSVYSGKRSIRNIRANSNVLRAGLFNSDAYCITRSSFVSDMAEWGIDAFFSISVSLAEYFPTIAEKLFTWPNFVDEKVYRDYGMQKSIPVLFTGSQATHYPWRNAVNRTLSQHFPTLSMPHFGWFDAAAAKRMIFGEDYARMLSAAVFAPTCGTIANEVVRKHFEIPACGTILVTERTAALESAGFVDMQNCIFVEPATVVERLDHLFSTKDRLNAISKAGRDLVHSRHTSKSRDQILQWYRLKTTMRPGSRIVQAGPFGPLTLAARNSPVRNCHVISHAIDRVILKDASSLLLEGRVEEAERKFRVCLNYHLMPEPLLGMARCCLGNAAPKEADKWIRQAISASEYHHAAEPDPIEWSYLLVIALAQGDNDGAIERAAEYPKLRHPLLDRARLVVHLLFPQKFALPSARSVPARASVHDAFAPSLEAWHEEAVQALRKAGQSTLAARVAQFRDASRNVTAETADEGADDIASGIEPIARVHPPKMSLPTRARGFANHWFRTFSNRVSEHVRRKSQQRSDFANVVLQTWQRNNPRFTLIVGGPSESAMLLQAAQRIPQSGQIAVSACRSDWPNSAARRTGALAAVISDQPIETIRTKLGASSFDAVIVFSPRQPIDVGFGDVSNASYVALDGIHEAPLQSLFTALLRANAHELIYFDPAGAGKAVLQRAIDAGLRSGLANAAECPAPLRAESVQVSSP